MSTPLDFNALVYAFEHTHRHFQQQAVKAVNISLTMRNWLFGFYISKFELNGADRAAYGDKLFDTLAQRFKHLKGVDRRALYRFKDFYLLYPHLQTVVASHAPLFEDVPAFAIVGSASPQLQATEKVGTLSPQWDDKLLVPAEKILQNLSYSHIELLLQVEDPLKRSFYEIAAIKGTLSVRELKRLIDTLAYERVGLSANAATATDDLLKKIIPEQAEHAIKNIYTFEFLGLRADGLLEEQDLESAILNHLQAFIQELGIGFCFEYRQRRILIDDEYYFIDLVFYHRILKCHVIVELKIDAFKQEHLGQLNTYVAYYNAEVKRPDDNPAIGILLCTEKGAKLVEYATAGMDNQLFVSKYLLQLPSKETLEHFIQHEIATWE